MAWTSLRNVCLAALVLTSIGCVGQPTFRIRSGDITSPRSQRREEALVRFESHRDNAQFQAAMERWQAGDPHTCEAQLRSLIARNPQHADARRALADLALERGETTAAEAELRAILEQLPNDAQTHHSLGLLLEQLSRPEEAASYLARAVELDPDNTLYQLCVQTDPAPPGQ